jgi:pyridoxine 5-phosphate synthase
MKKTISVPLNLEMAAVDEITTIACGVKPHTATLVPERREELTTEGGLKVSGNESLKTVVERLKNAGIAVSLFIDPVEEEVIASRELGVDIIELHTGTYCDVQSEQEQQSEFARLKAAAKKANGVGLIVAAGHGLHYENTNLLVEGIPLIEEYNIGHSIVARSIFVGMERAVREMKGLMEEL